MIRFLLVCITVIGFLILSIPILIVEWIIGKFNPYKKDISSLHLIQSVFRFILWLTGVEVTVIGEELVPTDEAVLYIGNHRSFFDILLTYTRCPRLTGYIAKAEMEKIPLLSNWMHYLHCLFLDRKDIKKGLKTILSGIELIKSGISVCIFPEGTRRPQPLPSEFKSGIWRLMREFPEVELIPVYIENLHRAMPKGVYIPVPTICSVHFGAPLEHSPDDPKEVFLTRARQAVIDLAQQQ